VPGSDGGPDVRVLVYRPRAASGPLPVVLSVHGGAFVHLRADTFAGMDARWAAELECLVVGVDYRLAPEHPFPAGLDDCYAALTWLWDCADDLGVDRDRIVVAGGSAGGALCAALTLLARDRNGPRIAFQVLLIPVIDDRLDTPSMIQGKESPGFSAVAAEGMWLHYLGDDYDRSATSPYAAPGRAVSLAGLPPAYIQTNGLDPLRDEGIDYAQRLLADGVQVELHNVPGAYHGAPPLDPAAAARAGGLLDASLRSALHPS
jgi:acetyl esterase